MKSLLELDRGELQQWLAAHGQPPYRAGQIARWLSQQRAAAFSEMTDLPARLREALAAEFLLWSGREAGRHRSADGTEKLVLDWNAGGRIEAVLLRDGGRRTICISTQVGCAMGCVFCASGLDGVDRNLTTGELREQMLRLQRCLPPAERLTHIVVMGMGEPLANLDHLLPALDWARDPAGLGISSRRITISTVGLPPAMRRLARHPVHYHLAVSLHAADDALRNELVPVNQRIGLEAILRAADEYFEASGRRLTFEYVLLGGVNDSPQQAAQLVQRLRGRPALLNVIPYNPVVGLPYRTPATAAIRQFRQILEQGGLTVRFRQRKGDDINAACGQLRRRFPAASPAP